MRALASMPFDQHPFGDILDTEPGSSDAPKDFEEARCEWINPAGYTPEALLKKVESALAASSSEDSGRSCPETDELRDRCDFLLTLMGRQ